MSFPDVKIKIPDRKLWLGDVNDFMHWKRARRIWGILKKVSSLSLAARRRRVTFACSPRPCRGCACDGGQMEKNIIERLCISLPCVETLNSKVIKGFVPKQRSRYVFFAFRDSYVLCIYVMNILCTFHISVSWVWYSTSTLLGNWKKLWNMKVTIIPIVIGAFGTVTKGL